MTRFSRAASIAIATFSIGLATLSHARRTAAQGLVAALPPPALEWQVPPGCPTRADVLAEIARLIGRAPTSHDAPADRARMAVRRDPRGRWHLRIEIVQDGTAARRALVSDTCRHAMSAAALVVALAIDESAREVQATAVGGQVPRTLAVVDDEVPPPVILGDAPPVVPVRRSSDVDVGLLARASGGIVLGVLPAPTAGVTVTSAIRVGAVEVQVRVGGVLGQRAVDRPVTGVGGDVSLVTLGGRLCLGGGGRSVRLSGCAGADGGWMRGVGVGNTDSRSATGPWVGIAAGPALEWRPVRWFSMELAGEAVVVVTAPRFEIDGRTAFDPPTLAGGARFGAGIHFP